MATGRFRLPARPIGLAALALVATGCAQSGPLSSRQTMVGSLKTSVSQLEYDNENLRKQVGELKADNRRIENDLVQERDANGEVTAQLDDAKDLIRRQGGDVTALGAPTKSTAFDDDGVPPPVSSPPARRTRNSGRKPPSASIPRGEPVAPFGSADPDADPGPAPRARDLGPRGSRDVDDRWLPVARGMGTPVRY